MKVRSFDISITRPRRLAKYIVPSVTVGVTVDLEEGDDYAECFRESHKELEETVTELLDIEAEAYRNRLKNREELG